MKIFGERILQLRKERKLGQEEVAKAVNISYHSYRRYENNEREPQASVIRDLADFFDVSTDYLLGKADSKGGS